MDAVEVVSPVATAGDSCDFSTANDAPRRAFATFVREFLLFGVKQARASLFGAYLLALIIITRYWYPPIALPRYDFLLLAAVSFQMLLLVTRMETPREAAVILVFHAVATAMEVFKTSERIGSWHYPGEFYAGIGNVPLFAGFMYSAVGSYIARVWRIFDFRFTNYPNRTASVVLVTAIYVNFFSHHFMLDLRYVLLVLSVVLFGRTQVLFRMDRVHRSMPLVVGWFLVALFIWIAENVATYARIWVYPTQSRDWHLVPFSKLVAWYLLMLLSFVLVSLLHRPRKDRVKPRAPSAAGQTRSRGR